MLTPASDVSVTASEITIESDSQAWVRRVEWGVERFREAGLELPAIDVTRHQDPDKAGCAGNGGLFEHGEPARVHLCTQSEPDSRAARLITLHELGHAWAETQLTAAQRSALVEIRGLEAWIDADVPRHEWGAEHAAEVVSWGLMDEMIPIIRVEDAEPPQLLAAFELLVGRSPLWTGT